MRTARTEVFIVDDNAIVRDTLARLIDHEPDLRVCGQAASGKQALADIAKLKPGVAIVDLSLGDMSGIDLVRKLRARASAPACLIVSMHEEGILAAEAFAAGAQGYLVKAHAALRILDAVRAVAHGGTYGKPAA